MKRGVGCFNLLFGCGLTFRDERCGSGHRYSIWLDSAAVLEFGKARDSHQQFVIDFRRVGDKEMSAGFAGDETSASRAVDQASLLHVEFRPVNSIVEHPLPAAR
jgi:hypothetical protein